ncbi:hypothetical protein OUZ56_012275 [Daphnia magna]|uniref:GMP synthase n=1 Tax=Daphnia magna TaxID=35525 RepID=A0ABQ9Z2I6_9CRUS|nr:hypothetical protein OUZ56_012275 [Daphnia magna]
MNSTSAVPVRYVVYSDERAAVKFPGFICAELRNIHRVTMNFFGQTVIVPEKIPIDTTASECYKMINTKNMYFRMSLDLTVTECEPSIGKL